MGEKSTTVAVSPAVSKDIGRLAAVMGLSKKKVVELAVELLKREVGIGGKEVD